MHAARQACRPKHQVLVLKCYPKFQKNAVEVKPNSSELSYLLYYASTRRSKLQKVGDFLDKRTTSDVWKGRIGNVQVTLEILKALIEKCPRDLPLYAGAVLRILRTVLRSNDITMVEESVPTFETFCAHQDPASLAADQDYIRRYEETVRLYAEFASKEAVSHTKTHISWPVAIRFRKAGLEAIKGVASSDVLAAETGRQLAVMIPVILLNIYSEKGNYLKRLENREQEKEEFDKEIAYRRRQSVSTVRTVETVEGDPAAASGTTEDADKLAEEDVGVVALQALRYIFTAVNRGQLRLATSAVLEFIGKRVKPHEHFTSRENRPLHTGSWPTALFAMICGWAPVQDRYTILVSTMEALICSPIVEEDMERQLVLATIIDYLLTSPINFIGLSVMDVLIGLISHTLLLLQLGGNGSTIHSHHQQTDAVGSGAELKNPATESSSSGSLTGGVVMEMVKEPSPFRVELLATLQKAMGSLATHVYYTDQISDMLSALLSRLKPSPLSSVPTAVAAIEDPDATIDALASSANLHEKPAYVDNFFSFENARLTALAAVKEILTVANTRRLDGSTNAVSRSQVEVSVWEGTQWLLRDPGGRVRKAYVDALLTWLNLELKKGNLRVAEDRRTSRAEKKEKEKENEKGNNMARRAVSNASQREKSPKRQKKTFITLLHLAIYENAHQYVDSEPDILLLHLLLANLVQNLGVNSARTGLPMIMRLQEDIQAIDHPEAKIRIGSLVHGYLWALSMAFDFEVSSVGRALHSEISRRNDKGLWLESIRVPPMPLNRIDIPVGSANSIRVPAEIVQTETLKPFDSREALVDRIADGYSSALYSPPSSPPSSPGRSFSISLNISPTIPKPKKPLPAKIREQLLSDWTKDACITSTAKDSSSSASISGSRTGTNTTSGHRNLLAVNTPNGTVDNHSPTSPHAHRHRSRPPSAAYGLVGHNGLPSPRRGSPSATPLSTSSMRSAVHVEDLKRVLSGSSPRPPLSRRDLARHADPNDTSSDSMVSADFSVSEISFAIADAPADRDGDKTPKPPAAAASAKDFAPHPDAVPPVPPLPPQLRAASVSPVGRPRTAPAPQTQQAQNVVAELNGSVGSLRQSRSLRRGGERGGSRSQEKEGGGSGSVRGRGRARMDFSGLLDAIEVGDEDENDEGEVERGVGVVGVRPPY